MPLLSSLSSSLLPFSLPLSSFPLYPPFFLLSPLLLSSLFSSLLPPSLPLPPFLPPKKIEEGEDGGGKGKREIPFV